MSPLKNLKYKNKILELSLLLNFAQKPIQILDSVKWGDEIEEGLLKSNFKELPVIDYKLKPLKFDTSKKLQEFRDLRLKITNELGDQDPLAAILIRNCIQYEDVVRMLMNRGTHVFYDYSKKLYGSPSELCNDGKTKLSDLSHSLNSLLTSLEESRFGDIYEKNLTAEMVVEELKIRLGNYFVSENIKVKLSDGIISDASAGSDYIKIKKGVMFSQRDLDVFEVHEGRVHLGTTINGQNQPYAKWLSKGPPCSTVTQEGLAVMMEFLTCALIPGRAKRLNDRLIAAQMAEEGANLLEVIDYYRGKNQTDRQAIRNAGRIFRGASLEGGTPFTKDIAYLKGFVMTYNFMRASVKDGRADLIPFLFAGKVALEDIPVLFDYHQMGVIDLPKYLPPQIRDLNGLVMWMTFSHFLDNMKIDGLVPGKKSSETGIIKKAS